MIMQPPSDKDMRWDVSKLPPARMQHRMKGVCARVCVRAPVCVCVCVCVCRRSYNKKAASSTSSSPIHTPLIIFTSHNLKTNTFLWMFNWMTAEAFKPKWIYQTGTGLVMSCREPLDCRTTRWPLVISQCALSVFFFFTGAPLRVEFCFSYAQLNNISAEKKRTRLAVCAKNRAGPHLIWCIFAASVQVTHFWKYDKYESYNKTLTLNNKVRG